ncbi:MAG: hypothetical protein HFH82_01130 [Lachnospiraceae bacterium]|nr:hypothetical protein [Lachnospiraceae bacterium]
MKNKLFYGLFVVYAIMVVFILYVNGVFTGNVTSVSNLAINGIFLAIIGVMFLVSAAGFLQLNRLTDDLERVSGVLQQEYKEAEAKNLWASLQDRKDLFEDENLRTAFAKYRLRVKSSRVGKRYANTCDIEDYVNEELLDRVGWNFFNSGISGTMTGLGILGTFMGLSLGLGSFSGDDIYTISDNVGPLLSGMKVAFHTSVYGIIFSLIFNFVYRSIMADAYGKLNFFLDVFRQCAMPPVGSGDENTAAMLVYQANMANYMKQLLELSKGEAGIQTKAMKQMANGFLEELQTVMGTQLKGLGDTLQSVIKAQDMDAEGSRRVLEAARALVESNRKMQENMEMILERQEKFAKELAEQKETLALTCDEMSRDLSNQLYTYEQMKEL